MTHPAVLAVLANPYLCMAIAEQHPTAYARLMLVSRPFHDWLQGSEEACVYDSEARDFRKKTVDKKAFKQNYMESWVVEKLWPHVAIKTVFLHSGKSQSVQDRPSSVQLRVREWHKNGERFREKGPCFICNWPTMPDYDPRYASFKKYNWRPESEGPFYLEIALNLWRDEKFAAANDTQYKLVRFRWEEEQEWRPCAVIFRDRHTFRIDCSVHRGGEGFERVAVPPSLWLDDNEE